jgi:nucleotide-binding universal stress UspA family protein
MAQTKAITANEAQAPATATGPVLVGFDGSPGGRDALELARLLCEVRGAKCIVATALEYGPVPVHAAALGDLETTEAGPLFEEARQALASIEVETHIVGTRSPARMLLEAAEREEAATLVVGAPHHSSRLGRAFLGSVAEHVLHHAPCEVVIAPHGYAGTRHVGIEQVSLAFDGTEESWVALRHAEALAGAAGASVQVLVAVDPVVSGVEAERDEGVRGGGKGVLTEALEAIDGSIETDGQMLEPGWRQGAPRVAEAIAAACEGDVLVCGTRRPLDRAFLGSATKHLVDSSTCPVLLAPQPPAPSPEK